MKQYDGTKFKFTETFNNPDGKTSGSSFIGVHLGLVAIFGTIAGIIGWYFQKADTMIFIDRMLQVGLLSSVLLGARKVANVFEKKYDNKDEM
jgi:hypothetical protein